MKTFCFTIDDNIRFLEELTETNEKSLFSHPYTALLYSLHERYGVKIQLNLFYKNETFDLTRFSDKYKEEWKQNADWLKLSFHSLYENVRSYEFSSYDEVYADCAAVQREIVRFAGEKSLAKTTTIHYCLLTEDGLRAMKDNATKGLLGLYGTPQKPRTSYGLKTTDSDSVRRGEVVYKDEIAHGGIDCVMNCFETTEVLRQLGEIKDRSQVRVMIHEQYFYPDYPLYQADFGVKLAKAFELLKQNGFESKFFEEMLVNE